VPELLFGSIKDSNITGKLCLAGPSAEQMCDALCGALAKLPGNEKVRSEKDDYDTDYDAVCRDVAITSGHATFSSMKSYFPRCDSMMAVLNTLAEENFQVVACPGHATFIWEKRPCVPIQGYLAVKDENIPGKLCIGGAGMASDPRLGIDLLEVLTTMCGDKVEQAEDDYDRSFDLAYRNTALSSGRATFTWAKPHWPHGHVLQMILQVLYRHGWVVEGGPNFGHNGDQWPGMVLRKVDAELAEGNSAPSEATQSAPECGS